MNTVKSLIQAQSEPDYGLNTNKNSFISELLISTAK